MEMQNDDLYDVIKRMPSALAETVVRYKDTQCANILNNGFTGTGSTWMTGMDGQALFSASHPLTGGGTYQNILSTAADLSVTSLETALYTFRLTVGDRNELLDLNPRYLIIPPQLERTAYELVKSSGRPDTANRADNWLNTQNLVILVWHRLSSSTAWYLASEKSQHNLVYYNRMELETDSDRDFNTKDFLYSVVTRFSVGWPDWRGVFGTPGV
jgi:phage major head subunit gpT-like protein